MKFAITGHTKGLGQALFNATTNSLGFSRSNGYDITKKEDRVRIIEEAKDVDVFVNCAYSGYSQTDLLYELFELWGNKQKIIVNIGSNTTCGIKNKSHIYTAHKVSLDKASEQLSHLDKPCKVMNLKFGWLGTERVIREFNPNKYIMLEDAVNFILQNVEWAKKYNITESLIRP